MTNSGAINNPWIKLAIVSVVGIVLIYAVLWGINVFNNNYYNGNMNMGYGYQMNGMQMGPQNGMRGYDYQNGMNMQGNMNGGMQGNMNGGMQGNMQGNMNGGMQGNMQGGMGMMGGMGMR